MKTLSAAISIGATLDAETEGHPALLAITLAQMRVQGNSIPGDGVGSEHAALRCGGRLRRTGRNGRWTPRSGSSAKPTRWLVEALRAASFISYSRVQRATATFVPLPCSGGKQEHGDPEMEVSFIHLSLSSLERRPILATVVVYGAVLGLVALALWLASSLGVRAHPDCLVQTAIVSCTAMALVT